MSSLGEEHLRSNAHSLTLQHTCHK